MLLAALDVKPLSDLGSKATDLGAARVSFALHWPKYRLAMNPGQQWTVLSKLEFIFKAWA